MKQLSFVKRFQDHKTKSQPIGWLQIVEKLMFFYNLFYFHRNDDG
ncbi:hypothetical protein US8_03122 [Bacillus altitudinis]|nr:hypothetical protein US8_03122 [Bacillus altitudinis]